MPKVITSFLTIYALHPALLFPVVHIQILVVDTFELASGQDGKKLPADGERLLDIAVRLIALGNVLLLKCIRKLRVD